MSNVTTPNVINPEFVIMSWKKNIASNLCCLGVFHEFQFPTSFTKFPVFPDPYPRDSNIILDILFRSRFHLVFEQSQFITFDISKLGIDWSQCNNA